MGVGGGTGRGERGRYRDGSGGLGEMEGKTNPLMQDMILKISFLGVVAFHGLILLPVTLLFLFLF